MDHRTARFLKKEYKRANRKNNPNLKPSDAWKVIAFIIVSPCLLWVVCTPCRILNNSTRLPGRHRVDKSGVNIRIEDRVLKRLVSPGSAEFSSFQWRKPKSGERMDGFIVIGYVDSQNKFGALLRTNIYALVDKHGRIEEILLDGAGME